VHVRVTPRAGGDALGGWHDGVLRVRLAAAPVDGRANEALLRPLARCAGVPPSSVRLLRGNRSRDKWLAFEGVDAAVLHGRLGMPPATPPA